jgi:SnoaL-like polyketide cyclase
MSEREQQDPQVRIPLRMPQWARTHFSRIERQKRMLMAVVSIWLHDVHGDPIKGDPPAEPDEDAPPEPDERPLKRARIENPERRAMSRSYLGGISNVDFKVMGQLAQTDTAASRWEVIATHSGELLGVPATGREIEFAGMTVVKFADDMATEEWTYWDLPHLMEQIGLKP